MLLPESLMLAAAAEGGELYLSGIRLAKGGVAVSANEAATTS